MKENSRPTIFVVVLNYNGKDTLISCLSSVYQSDYPNLEVVVVDNNSDDSSFETAKNQFSRAHFIRNSKNMGFARGNNIGIRFALEKFADYVLVLNNDAYLERNTLSELTAAAEASSASAIINPLIFNDDNETVWFAGGKVRWSKMKNTHVKKSTGKKGLISTAYCTGCAMLISKKIFKKIGLFDERYFLYYEDADFSLRAKKAGFDLYVCQSAKVRHSEQSSIKNDFKNYWLVLSGALFFFSHSNLIQKAWISTYFQLRKLKNLYLLAFKPSPQASMMRQAYKDFNKADRK